MPDQFVISSESSSRADARTGRTYRYCFYGLATSEFTHVVAVIVLAIGLPRINGCGWQPPQIEIQQGRASVALMASAPSAAKRAEAEPTELAETAVEIDLPEPVDSPSPWPRPDLPPPPPAEDPPTSRQAAVQSVTRRAPLLLAISAQVAVADQAVELEHTTKEVSTTERMPASSKPPQPQAALQGGSPPRQRTTSAETPRELAADEISSVAQAASPASQAREGADVDDLPQIVSNPAPAYPPAALLSGITGRVVLRVMVGSTGLPKRVSLMTSSGHGTLDAAALAAVRRWRFRPAQRDGQGVEFEVAVPVRFALRR